MTHFNLSTYMFATHSMKTRNNLTSLNMHHGNHKLQKLGTILFHFYYFVHNRCIVETSVILCFRFLVHVIAIFLS